MPAIFWKTPFLVHFGTLQSIATSAYRPTPPSMSGNVRSGEFPDDCGLFWLSPPLLQLSLEPVLDLDGCRATLAAVEPEKIAICCTFCHSRPVCRLSHKQGKRSHSRPGLVARLQVMNHPAPSPQEALA
jgi:hypothetical protein